MELRSLVENSIEHIKKNSLNSDVFENLLDLLDMADIEIGDKTTWNCKRLVLDKSILHNSEELGYNVLCAFIKNTILLSVLINSDNSKMFRRLVDVFDLRDSQDIEITQEDVEMYMNELLNFNIYSDEEVEIIVEVDECVIFNCSMFKLATKISGKIDIYLVGALGLVYNKRDYRLEDNDYITSSGISIHEVKETNDVLNSLV